MSLGILNKPRPSKPEGDREGCRKPLRDHAEATEPVGYTVELTSAAGVRAIDTLLNVFTAAGSERKLRTAPQSALRKNADVVIFAYSAGAIMWSWFYSPEVMSKTYRLWIQEAAQIDRRLIEALRSCRDGTFLYGSKSEQPNLQRMCLEEGWPLEWANPQITTPVPCDMVHMGLGGSSCSLHAARRFAQAFKFAMPMYLPLQFVVKMRNPATHSLRNAMVEATRSSAFLGATVVLFYYAVCLSRTIIGPRLLGRSRESHQFLDSGACIQAGSVLCGWSILVETPKRRAELALLVAPKAVGFWLPKRYKREVGVTSSTRPLQSTDVVPSASGWNSWLSVSLAVPSWRLLNTIRGPFAVSWASSVTASSDKT